jgi:hypothetical protein
LIGPIDDIKDRIIELADFTFDLVLNSFFHFSPSLSLMNSLIPRPANIIILIWKATEMRMVFPTKSRKKVDTQI